jgi:hypothetical protein
MEPIEQVLAKVELIIRPDGFLEFSELAEENEIEFKVLTDDVQRSEKIALIFFKNIFYFINF